MTTHALIPASDALGLDEISVRSGMAEVYYRRLRRRHGWTLPNAVHGARLFTLADRMGWTVSWEDDWDNDHEECCYWEHCRWDAVNRRCVHSGKHTVPDSCEQAILYDEDENVLAALGCIDDADESYRDDVATDLIWEALAQMDVAA